MTSRFFLVAVLSLTFLATSCKKAPNDTLPEDELSIGTLQFKADGELHVFTGVLGIVAVDTIFSNIKTFSIEAFDISLGKEFKIYFDFTNAPFPQAGVDYKTTGPDCEPLPTSTETCPLLAFTPGSQASHQYTNLTEGAHSTITFSELDASGNGVAKGALSGILVDQNDASASIEVTEGLFHVSVY